MELFDRFFEEILVFRPRKFAGENSESRISFETRLLESVGVKALFVQENQSRSFTNVLRGLHYQIKHPQGRLIQVIRGKVFNAVVDLQ